MSDKKSDEMTIEMKCKNAAWQEIIKCRVETQERFWAFFEAPICLALV